MEDVFGKIFIGKVTKLKIDFHSIPVLLNGISASFKSHFYTQPPAAIDFGLQTAVLRISSILNKFVAL